jgi:hypothetical protein
MSAENERYVNFQKPKRPIVFGKEVTDAVSGV